MDEFTDWLREELKTFGYHIDKSRSRTTFGDSNYLIVHRNEKGFLEGDSSKKIRISDHSVTNIDRVYGEIHVHYPVIENKEIKSCILQVQEKNEILNDCGRVLNINHNGEKVTIISYNTGGRKNKNVFYSHNSMLMSNEIEKYLGINTKEAYVYASQFADYSIEWNDSIGGFWKI